MSSEKYINLDGNFFPAGDPVLTPKNRAFRYGDGIFESVRLAGGALMFLDRHYSRVLNSTRLLKMDIPEYFSFEFFRETIENLVKKNGIGSDGRIRFTIFRKEGGFYAPDTNDISYLVEAYKYSDEGYTLNPKGLTVDIFSEFKKPVNKISNIKTCNSVYFVLAGVFKNQNSIDDCIILNDKGNIIESISSNIFAVKNGVLYTCPVSEGCVDGVMRQEIIRIAIKNRIAVYEVQIPMNVLLNADELFLTNAVKGIQWIGAYKSKRYFNNTSKKLVDLLNAEVNASVEG